MFGYSSKTTYSWVNEMHKLIANDSIPTEYLANVKLNQTELSFIFFLLMHC